MDDVPVNVLGFLDQMRVSLEVSTKSEHLHALLRRAAAGRGLRECSWWEEEKSGVPAGDICGERSEVILNLACIDCLLDEHLVGYSTVGGEVPDFRAWLLEHVRLACLEVLSGAHTPQDMGEKLASPAGKLAIEQGLLAAETALADAGDPLSNVGRAGLRVGWGNVQCAGDTWQIHSERKDGRVIFTGCVAGGASGTLVASDLGGVLYLQGMNAKWGTGGATHHSDCCLFRALGQQICRLLAHTSPL